MRDMKDLIEKQKSFFAGGRTRECAFRITQLKKLKRAVSVYEGQILKALEADLNKPEFEAYATELGLLLDEMSYVISKLKKWVRGKRVHTSMVNFPSVSRILSEPYGTALIISPWNYPLLLSLQPLTGALCAGNCAVVKPSEFCPHVSAVIAKMIGDNFPEEYVAVVEGGCEESQSLLEQQFDYIFFTGSERVGKSVMEAASKHLTPVCLELGGKSPCVVDETADIKLAAKRIVWGKFLNAGQTCVAPDYLLVHHNVKNELIGYMKSYICEFYGEENGFDEKYPRIVNEKHFKRLTSFLEEEKVLMGGQSNADTLQISPTLLGDVSWKDPVMQEEIFGPILPIMTFGNFKEAIYEINARSRPLAAYLFTKEPRREKEFLRCVSFGGGCINDTVMHLVSDHLPFGGVGNSGMGAYHGKYSFDTFSHKKSVLKKSCLVDTPFRYPPYKDSHFKLMRYLMK